jgi:hypothetical protein
MRNLKHLKYGVLALTPLLGAGSFAQTFNLGMNNGAFMLAQAPTQSGSYGAMNGAGKPEAAREAGTDHAGTPKGGETKLDSPAPSAVNSKTMPRPQAKTQARKVEKKSKDNGTN